MKKAIVTMLIPVSLFCASSPPVPVDVPPSLEEYSGRWIQLEKDGDSFFVYTSCDGRYNYLEFNLGDRGNPLLLFSYVQSADQVKILNVLQSGTGTIFTVKYYNYLNGQVSGQEYTIELEFIDGKNLVSIKRPGSLPTLYMRELNPVRAEWRRESNCDDRR